MDKKKKMQGSCESCAFYVFDEDYEYYVCEADLDEDEMFAFLRGTDFGCSYYRPGDEYLIVRKQM
ncbi:MAG: hypothetical protein J6L96_09885 [Clostridia bacterium]|nr:hypothetical protein [Clostridia bacterium]